MMMTVGHSTRSAAEFLALLEAHGVTGVADVMCAESKWWQCHRQLIADALVARGIEVRHILSAGEAPAHQLTPFARQEGQELTYPGLI
ncbi:MAG: DUF488 family protein [Acidimicrobiia bacterium]|nr:DUF488 family protein [Acidimicrobiia bacterium]